MSDNKKNVSGAWECRTIGVPPPKKNPESRGSNSEVMFSLTVESKIVRPKTPTMKKGRNNTNK